MQLELSRFNEKREGKAVVKAIDRGAERKEKKVRRERLITFLRGRMQDYSMIEVKKEALK